MATQDVFLKCVCPSCQQHIEFPITASGETITCPSCNTQIELPVSQAKPAIPILEPIPPAIFGLPEITDPAFAAFQVRSSDGATYYTVNLLEYTCTCPSFVADHSGAPPRDFGRVCKHICRALNQKQFLSLMDPICKAIVEEGYGINPGRFAADQNGKTVYITGVNSKGWLNVFALKRRDGKTYFRFGYSVIEGRWSFGSKPKIRDEVVNPYSAMPLQPMPSQDSGIAISILTGAGRFLLFCLRGIILICGTVLAVVGGILAGLLGGTKGSRRRW